MIYNPKPVHFLLGVTCCRFLRSDEEMVGDTWEKKVAIKYYDKLFKEYCLADLSRHKESKIGMRWRTQKEVFSGKGQFACGNIACNVREDLSSYEVPFSYKEDGQEKMALVKLRCCPACALKVSSPPQPLPTPAPKTLALCDCRCCTRLLNSFIFLQLNHKFRKRQRRLHKEDGGDGGDDDGRQAEGDAGPGKTKAKRGRGDAKAASDSQEELDGDDGDAAAAASSAAAAAKDDSEIWRRKPQLEERGGDEFDEFLMGIFR